MPLTRPYTVVSCAISVDGCLDDTSPQRLILSGPADLDEVDELRACVDAVLVGAGTIRADNPRLLVRSPARIASRVARGLPEHPLRVTLTASGDLDPGARFFTGPGRWLVYEGQPLAVVLDNLSTERHVATLLIEGGSRVLAETLSTGLADELRLAVAPFFVGEATAPRFAIPAPYPHSAGSPMRLESARRLDGVAVLTYRLSGRERPVSLFAPHVADPTGSLPEGSDEKGSLIPLLAASSPRPTLWSEWVGPAGRSVAAGRHRGGTVTVGGTVAAGEIQGTCSEQFKSVREELAARLASGDELGASIVINIDGEVVADMWGGFRDEARTTPWTADTIVNVWSTTKTVTSLAALMLVDRGLIDPYAPVAWYWPEFAASGKQDIEVRHLLSHTSGVSGWEQPVAIEDMYDWEASTARLAAQAPWWEPGTASGYHALSQGHLVGEVIRRVSGKPLRQFVAEEIAGPLGADFQIGAAERDWGRIAQIIPPPPLPFDLEALAADSPMVKTLTGPAADAAAANTPGWRNATLGAVNGHGNAGSVARVLSVITLGGAVDGIRLLAPETIDLIFDEQSYGVDLVLGVPLRFGIGYGLPVLETVPYVPEGKICFWGGWGGSLILMDLDRRLTFAYMMNKMGPGVIGSDRSAAYTTALYTALQP